MHTKQVHYGLLFVGLMFVAISSMIGSVVLQFIPVHDLEHIIPFVLLCVLVDYLANSRKQHITNSSTTLIPHKTKFAVLGTIIGFYNGCLGPGTGSIWTAMLMKFFNINIRTATMYAKPLNLAGNFAALLIFILSGRVNYTVAIAMGCGSFMGGRIGAYLVVYKNLRILRIAFITMMVVSIVLTFLKFEFHVLV